MTPTHRRCRPASCCGSSTGTAFATSSSAASPRPSRERVTFDIDLVPEWSEANLGRLAEALREADARLVAPEASEPPEFPIDARSLRQFEVSTWRTTHGDLDVVVGTPTAKRGVLASYRDLAERAAKRDAYGVTILVAALDDVIESKQALGRESDLVALPELHRLRSRLT